MTFNILKCHGSGNDFILIDERNLPRLFHAAEREQLALSLCDRETGIGADGILFLQESPPQDGRMVIYNADGSEASMCGNGLRCIVRVVAETLGKQSLQLATKGGIYESRVVPGFYDSLTGYSVKIDTVDFNAAVMLKGWKGRRLENEILPFLPGGLAFTAANVPNPHIIAPVSRPDSSLLEAVGKRCNLNRDHFTDGVNVNFFTPLGNDRLFVETYERGVGLTNACGTGMVASSLIAYLLGYVPAGNWITVYNKGGLVKTRIVKTPSGDYAVELLGNATFEFTGKLSFDFQDNQYTFEKLEEFPDEKIQYQSIEEAATEAVRKSATIL